MDIGHFLVLDFGKMFHLHNRQHQSFWHLFQCWLHLGTIHHDQYNMWFPRLAVRKMEYNRTRHLLLAPIFLHGERLPDQHYHHGSRIIHTLFRVENSELKYGIPANHAKIMISNSFLFWVHFDGMHRHGKLDLGHIILYIPVRI